MLMLYCGFFLFKELKRFWLLWGFLKYVTYIYIYVLSTIYNGTCTCTWAIQLSYGIKYIISEFLANLRLFCHYISLLPMYWL